MKFTELHDYRLPGGEVTAWIPESEQSTDRWPVDARGITYEHEDHLHRAVTAAHDDLRQTSWLGAIFRIDRPLDPAAMHRTLHQWIRRHEAFRTTVSRERTSAALDVPDAEDDSRFVRRSCDPSSVSIRRVGAGRFGPERIREHLVDLFDSRLTPLAWPHCLMATIAHADDPSAGPDGFHLVFAADHSIMDAYSMLLSVNELRQIYDSEEQYLDPVLPEVGSHVDFSSHNRMSAAEIADDHPGVRRWREFLDDAGGFPRFGLAPVETQSGEDEVASEAPAQDGWAQHVATDEQVTALNRLSRSTGHSTQTAIIAALALAYQDLTGENRLRAAMPMHTRHDRQFVESVGWFVGLGPLEVDLTHAETVVDALEAAAGGIRESKRLSLLPFPRVAQLLDTDAVPQFVISYLDLRAVPGAEDWPEWEARTLRGAARSDSEVYIWIARTPTGITVSSRYPANDVIAAQVRRLVTTACSIATAVLEDASASDADSRPRTTHDFDSGTSAGHEERRLA
ncbi:condensation domain-containing protein [Gordonia sp. PKS22-38]|uniref:Condensation domain-containing protein n=1 Tax=Gordonia prachuapensis TaxID=3115651 RepID=A0ABU7MVA1_9ACTN|nr:condensation domain-containing protein [Gordonia sp. PKS22-38]